MFQLLERAGVGQHQQHKGIQTGQGDPEQGKTPRTRIFATAEPASSHTPRAKDGEICEAEMLQAQDVRKHHKLHGQRKAVMRQAQAVRTGRKGFQGTRNSSPITTHLEHRLKKMNTRTITSSRKHQFLKD